MKDMGSRIRAYRSERKLSQTDLAQRLGVTGAAVSAYENGTRQPSYDILIRIANVLGTSLDELLGRSGPGGQRLDVSGLSGEQIRLLQQLAEQFADYNRLRAREGQRPES